jgi:three-Cys-motif partner protein
MAKNINAKPFDEGTLRKLFIFKECFKEWLPVFIHNKFIDKIYIYDFFAGSGKDVVGNLGSPLILLDVAKGENCEYCSSIKGKELENKVIFLFNEKEPNLKSQKKFNELNLNVNDFIDKCAKDNLCDEGCIYKPYISNEDFKERFRESENLKYILSNKKYAKFILLDQYGYTQIDDDIFLTLVNSPATDFIFFISSAFVKRFAEHKSTKKHFPNMEINFDENKPKECHKLIADYFENLIPKNKEYYLNHFTIKKGANYYGLIFGTNHTLGMEKFQKVCWDVDSKAGEADFNLNDDFLEGTLFYGKVETNKIQSVKEEIKQKILSRKITNNIDGLKLSLKLRCLPKIFTDVVKELEKNGKIRRIGDSTYKSTNIHHINKGGRDYYDIELK